ncbi:hypothetical protein BSKO_02557 [Bryopsis sp. KO-2023]|nr:hypothetical protein BSKO_02557 [Bryopsis sp. KO-2023]
MAEFSTDKYEHIRDLGSGNFGTARLMRSRESGELVAVKFIERGEKIDKNVEREIINHRMLCHPNIIAFRELFVTPDSLGIVMEYAAGGELFDRIVKAGRFSEDEARYFFQQLIHGVEFCHKSGVCHRDLKLENVLLDGSTKPLLKICDFGYSKSSVLDSMPKTTVGTPAYIAPEVLQRKEYDGQIADVWSCGVTLYVMLVGAYPFEDPHDPRNFRKTIQRIMSVRYSFPPNLRVTRECLDVLEKIFVANPVDRITIADIKQHAWYVKGMTEDPEGKDVQDSTIRAAPHQSVDDIQRLVQSARRKESEPRDVVDIGNLEDEILDEELDVWVA